MKEIEDIPQLPSYLIGNHQIRGSVIPVLDIVRILFNH
ncbi:hypothetical protein ACIQ4Z_18630 [Peribacillus asahii]